jgi:hypothetical protein
MSTCIATPRNIQLHYTPRTRWLRAGLRSFSAARNYKRDTCLNLTVSHLSSAPGVGGRAGSERLTITEEADQDREGLIIGFERRAYKGREPTRLTPLRL